MEFNGLSHRLIRNLVLLGLIFAAGTPARAAKLASPSAKVTDTAGATRATFSSTERVMFTVQVQNTAAGSGNIQFSFEVKDPGGARRLFQTGNSAPGNVLGIARSSLSGVTVSQFYSSPGQYTLVTRATLDGETVEASAAFTVLSPLITLTYPPNNARDLIDQPLILRWVSSGASLYRISVDDDNSFYNALLTAQTPTNFFAYPLNPTDERQRLASGQVYYWKVEGLDASCNVVAKTDVPFSFTVKAQAAQATSRDLAIVNLEKVNEAVPGMPPGALPVAVHVKNQGGRPETEVPVNLFVDGAAVPSSPKRLQNIEPGKTHKLVFPIRAPEDGRPALLNAFIDFFDDNLQNNRLSRQIQAEESVPGRQKLSPTDVWDAIKRLVSDPNVLAELEGYTAEGIVGDGVSREDIDRLIQALKDGKAKVLNIHLRPVEQ